MSPPSRWPSTSPGASPEPTENRHEQTCQTLDRRRMGRLHATGAIPRPGQRPTDRHLCRRRAGRGRCGHRRGIAGLRRRPVEGGPCPAGEGPRGDRRRLRAPRRPAHRAAGPGERQDQARGGLRGRHGAGQVALLRRPGAQRARRQRHAAARRGVAGAARTDGRGRDHRAVEFAGGPAGPRAGPGAGRRHHRRGEDAGADRADQCPGGADHRRGARPCPAGW
ncbi:Uncharacterised protein [Streptococcus dysgalactiae subsp. equisimilis]|nr:Uncharacterised protein [Streptococcus dysgalactiae subsp. equisimilis]